MSPAPHLSDIRRLAGERNAVILAHTYQPGPIQDCADFVGDSYGLSVRACDVEARRIIFCGVQFMAETAAILNPSRPVVMPAPDAGCPMADMIDKESLLELKSEHPDHLVVCYVNSPAEVKALSDVCVTSSNAVTIVSKLPADRGIIFVPDKYLGSYVSSQCGREMVLWPGFCPTHARITPEMVTESRRAHPGAVVMMHPEAPPESRERADAILSTGRMCTFARDNPAREFIAATETGLVHTLRKQNPDKRFYPLSDRIVCPNMKKCSLQQVADALEGKSGRSIEVPGEVAGKALGALRKMLDMS